MNIIQEAFQLRAQTLNACSGGGSSERRTVGREGTPWGFSSVLTFHFAMPRAGSGSGGLSARSAEDFPPGRARPRHGDQAGGAAPFRAALSPLRAPSPRSPRSRPASPTLGAARRSRAETR